MLPQFGFTEFMLVAIVALIVVGPKDLPMMMRKLGQFVAKGKAMAREFQSAFDDIARQAELDELRKEIEDLRRDNALSEAVNEMKKTEADINRKVMMGDKARGETKAAEDAAPASGDKSADDKPAVAAKPVTRDPLTPEKTPETETAPDVMPEKKASST